MSLFETGDSDGLVSLSGLFEEHFKKARVQTNLHKIADLICKGGWPGALHVEPDVAQLIPNQYLDTLISSIGNKNGSSNDPEQSKLPGTNEHKLRRFLVSLARNTGQAVTYQTIASDIIEGNIDSKNKLVSQQHIESLFSVFKERFFIEDLNG